MLLSLSIFQGVFMDAEGKLTKGPEYIITPQSNSGSESGGIVKGVRSAILDIRDGHNITKMYGELEESARYTAMLIGHYFPDTPFDYERILEGILLHVKNTISNTKSGDKDIFDWLSSLSGRIRVFGDVFKASIRPGAKTVNLDHIRGLHRQYRKVSYKEKGLIEKMKDLYRMAYSYDPEFLDFILGMFDKSIDSGRFVLIYFSKIGSENPESSIDNLVGTLRFSSYPNIEGLKTEYMGAANLDPEFQSFGIMPVIALEAIKQRFENGTSIIVGHTIPGTIAEKIWQSLGFVITGQEEMGSRKNNDKIVLNKIRLDYPKFKELLQERRYKNLGRESTLNEETARFVSQGGNTHNIPIPRLMTDGGLQFVLKRLKEKGEQISEYDEIFIKRLLKHFILLGLKRISDKGIAEDWIDMDYKHSIASLIKQSLVDVINVMTDTSGFGKLRRLLLQGRLYIENIL